MVKRKIKVLISDNNDISREGLNQILRSEHNVIVAGAINHKEDLIEMVEKTQPEVVIASMEGDADHEIAATQTITEKFPAVAVLAISDFQYDRSIVAILRAGAKGCLLKTAKRNEVAKAINTLHNLEPYYSMEVIARLNKIIASGDLKSYINRDFEKLKDKDKYFLRLLCDELTIKEISLRMKVSVRSVEHRKQKLYTLLDKSNIAGLIKYAILNGIYNPYTESPG